MDTQLAPWLQSSQDPESVANKVRGVILAISGVIILIAAQLFHLQLSSNDVVTFATETSSIAGAVWAIYGSILHLVTWFGTIKKQTIAQPQQVPTQTT